MVKALKSILCIGLVILLSGCLVRTYKETKDRVDQNLTNTAGNRGYLVGNPPPVDESARRKTRTTYVAEVEMAGPKQAAEQPAKTAAEPAEEEMEQPAGNRGYVEGRAQVKTEAPRRPVEPTVVQYTVKKGDTLQKISKHFFGTTKKWYKLYKYNQDKIKNPDRIKAGLVLDIPKELN
jgi:nucleoid-associated protein YgaU